MANEITAQGGSGSVLLTGGASAVGRAAIRQFIAAGYRVFAAVDSTDSARAIRADGAIPVYPNLLRAGEVRAAIEAAGASIVVNLAPQAANHGLSAGQWDAEWIALITQGTQAIMEAATAANVQFVVHTSPLFAGGHGDDEAAAALIDAARTGEQLVLGCSTPGCVLRFGFIYGAEQGELTALRDTLRMGRALTGVDGHAHSHWLHAADAARAVVLAAQKQMSETVIDVTDNQPASPLDFFGYFSESQGLTAPSSGGFNLRALLFGEKPVNVAAIDVHPDANEAASRLGWKPQFASYRQGIDDLLLTWRAARAGAVNA